MKGNTNYDVAIIGGGPAGSSLAAYLGKARIRCVLFEKEVFPREHVGESLVPAAHRVLEDIGVMDKMEEAGFPKKFGAAWSSSENTKVYNHDWEGIEESCKVDIRFDEIEQEHKRNYTYHVDRAKFDHILLLNAIDSGATVHQSTKVTAFHHEPGNLVRLEFKLNNEPQFVHTRLVVDASGRNTFLGSRFKLKEKDPNFEQYAIHTWYKGFERGLEPKDDFIFIHFLPIPNSWVWQIPITENITSIGVITQKKHFASSKKERADFFHECLKKYPELHKKILNAEQIRPLKSEGNYSYKMTNFVGDGWALVGDAARFVDPIFSSGVSVALNSSRFLFNEIKEKLIHENKNSLITKEALQGYEGILKKGIKNWYTFISLYYRLNVVFTWFVNSPKHRLDILKLLSGDVYDEKEPAVLQEMRMFVEKVEQNPNHVLYPLLKKLNEIDFNNEL